MKDLKTQERFIELRASGRSYNDISVELKVSKTTLVEMSKKFRREICNLRAMGLDAIQRRFKLDEEARIEMFGEMLAKLKEEFSKRDLTTLPTDKLLDQITKISSLVANRHSNPKFLSEHDIFDNNHNTEWSA